MVVDVGDIGFICVPTTSALRTGHSHRRADALGNPGDLESGADQTRRLNLLALA